jgi:hypothetical protein
VSAAEGSQATVLRARCMESPGLALRGDVRGGWSRSRSRAQGAGGHVLAGSWSSTAIPRTLATLAIAASLAAVVPAGERNVADVSDVAGVTGPNGVIMPIDDEAQVGGAVGRILQEDGGADGVAGPANGTNATAVPVALNFTKICPEQDYPAQHPECQPMLYTLCSASNFTAEVRRRAV